MITSNIDGSISLLGEDYAGYYPVEDGQALAELLLKTETDRIIYNQLEQSCIARQSLFTPENELNGWNKLPKLI